MRSLTKRNCLIYFRNPGGVALSLIGSLMVLVVYLLFLGDNLAGAFTMLPNAQLMVTSWMLAGLCAIAPLTSSLGVAGALVNDRIQGTDRDFLASPVARYKIAGGYLLSSILASFLVTLVITAVSITWLLLMGAAVPSVLVLAKLLGILALSCLSSACITFCIVTFIYKNGTYTGVSTVVGTLGGFLSGIYLPLGELPAAVQGVVKLFPPSHSAVLLRTLFLQNLSAESYAGLPTAAVDAIWETLGVRFYVGDALVPLWVSVLVLAGTAVLFFCLSTLLVARKAR